jgi:hypothetical protein
MVGAVTISFTERVSVEVSVRDDGAVGVEDAVADA